MDKSVTLKYIAIKDIISDKFKLLKDSVIKVNTSFSTDKNGIIATTQYKIHHLEGDSDVPQESLDILMCLVSASNTTDYFKVVSDDTINLKQINLKQGDEVYFIKDKQTIYVVLSVDYFNETVKVQIKGRSKINEFKISDVKKYTTFWYINSSGIICHDYKEKNLPRYHWTLVTDNNFKSYEEVRERYDSLSTVVSKMTESK